MSSRPLLAHTPPVAQLVILLGLVMLSMALSSFLGLIAAVVAYDIPLFDDPEILNDITSTLDVGALKLVQLFNSLGMFLLPPAILVLLTVRKKASYLSLNVGVNLLSLIFIAVLMVGALPLINFMAELNSSVELPASMAHIEEWMKASEASAAELTAKFLDMPTHGDLLYTLLLVAVIPAIGEELLFRGALQRIFLSMSGNPHVAIWITGAIFSAIHLQFYGFVPRMLLGAFFGYLLWWSGSLWLPIVAHFVNNATAVMLSWYAQQNNSDTDFETLGSSADQWLLVAGSLILVSGLAFLLYRNRNEKYLTAQLQVDGERDFLIEDR